MSTVTVIMLFVVHIIMGIIIISVHGCEIMYFISHAPIATAQLSLSTPTVAQCYDRLVTLVCTHPVLPQGQTYIHADVSWMRDGTAVSTVGLGLTKPNSTTTTLQFTIAEQTTGNYTCFLVNLVQSRTDKSNSVSVRPLGEYSFLSSHSV